MSQHDHSKLALNNFAVPIDPQIQTRKYTLCILRFEKILLIGKMGLSRYPLSCTKAL